MGTREPIVKQAESERRGPQAALANGGAVSLQLGPSEVPPKQSHPFSACSSRRGLGAVSGCDQHVTKEHAGTSASWFLDPTKRDTAKPIRRVTGEHQLLGAVTCIPRLPASLAQGQHPALGDHPARGAPLQSCCPGPLPASGPQHANAWKLQRSPGGWGLGTGDSSTKIQVERKALRYRERTRGGLSSPHRRLSKAHSESSPTSHPATHPVSGQGACPGLIKTRWVVECTLEYVSKEKPE